MASGGLFYLPNLNLQRVHAGEFLRLLKELAPGEEKFYRDGALEVEEAIGELKK
jgi:hypothetical protein